MRMLRNAAVLLLALPLLTACTSTACASWVAYDSAERMRESATIVVDAARIEPAGTAGWSGVQANVYDVTGASVGPDGEVQEAALELRVLSTPETCSASIYPEGDPMLEADRALLYLIEDRGELRTLTPFAGVEPR